MLLLFIILSYEVVPIIVFNVVPLEFFINTLDVLDRDPIVIEPPEILTLFESKNVCA